MFSYRHAFHAGNHADVLKHLVLCSALDYLRQKETALALIDTHAGCGLYRLDGDFAQTSGESLEGVRRLLAQGETGETEETTEETAPALQQYLELVRSFNAGGGAGRGKRIYPGSPALMQALMREQDRLHAFELQPADMRALQGNLAQGPHAAHARVWHEDGWAGSLRLLPPPSRRALVLCDPSYEMKTDYAQAQRWLAEALRKFATGTYIVWFPIIPRPEAHELPRKLTTIARQAGKPSLLATLAIRSGGKPSVKARGGAQAAAHLPGQKPKRGGMAASGVLVVNPPYTLAAHLRQALPQVVAALGQDHMAGFKLTENP